MVLILKAIRRRFISRGVHPSRAVLIEKVKRLIIRHTDTRCKTFVWHDESFLHLDHAPMTGARFLDSREIPLSDPELIDKAVQILADFD